MLHKILTGVLLAIVMLSTLTFMHPVSAAPYQSVNAQAEPIGTMGVTGYWHHHSRWWYRHHHYHYSNGIWIHL